MMPIPNLPALTSPAMAPLRELLADPAVETVGHDLKADLTVLLRAGVEVVGPIFDTMIASYVVDPSRRSHGLQELSTQLLIFKTTLLEEVVGKARKKVPFEEVALEAAGLRICEQVDCAGSACRLSSGRSSERH